MSFDRRLRELRAALSGDFIPAAEAGKFVAMMERDHPGELSEWMRTHAVQFATEALSALIRHERHAEARRASSRAFALTTKKEDGDLSPFLVCFEIDPNHTRRPVAEMSGTDHLFVARRYASTGKRALLLAEFHRTIAKKVKTRRTSDVMTEAEYVRLRQSIVAPDDQLAAQAA